MQKLPESVLINHRVYKLVIKDDLRNDDDEKLYGQIDYESREIRIKTDIPEDITRSALLHEIIHGLAYAAGDVLSESQVTMLGIGLHDVLWANPEIARILINDD
jgi:hypothetical protein